MDRWMDRWIGECVVDKPPKFLAPGLMGHADLGQSQSWDMLPSYETVCD